MPGGASLTGVMYLDASAPRDGTAISIFNFGLIGNSRVQPDVVKVDFRKYNWIGSIGEDPPICYVSSRLGIKTLAQLQGHGTVHMGRTSGGTAGDIAQKILKKLVHIDIKQVSGYPGNAEAKLAFDRGEIDGNCGPWGEVPADWIDERKIVPLLNLGSFKPDQLPSDVPFAVDAVTSSVDKAIIRMLTLGSEISRPFVASGAVPASQVRVLRDAFDATTRDPAFLADARKAGVLVAPRSGQEAQKIVEDIYSAPADVVLAARRLMED
jgi:tripartite-type tricarboxylate transporter receptor subunit TctC